MITNKICCSWKNICIETSYGYCPFTKKTNVIYCALLMNHEPMFYTQCTAPNQFPCLSNNHRRMGRSNHCHPLGYPAYSPLKLFWQLLVSLLLLTGFLIVFGCLGALLSLAPFSAKISLVRRTCNNSWCLTSLLWLNYKFWHLKCIQMTYRFLPWLVPCLLWWGFHQWLQGSKFVIFAGVQVDTITRVTKSSIRIGNLLSNKR